MNYQDFKYFLNLFQYGDDTHKKECVNYIIEQIKKSEVTKKTLNFDKFKDLKYSPNLCLDHDGNLMLNTKSLLDIYYEYKNKVQVVDSEVANIVIENRRILRDIANRPFIPESMLDEEDN